MSQVTVLDASAVLAFLQAEAGHELVRVALQNEHCFVTAANQSEIISKALDKGIAPSNLDTLLHELGYVVIEVSATDGALAGWMRNDTRDFGLSLGDRLCLASAKRLKANVLTADRVWLNVATILDVNIICIRPQADELILAQKN